MIDTTICRSQWSFVYFKAKSGALDMLQWVEQTQIIGVIAGSYSGTLNGRERSVMIKAVIAYDIVEGVDVQEYDDWLVDVHMPDLLANPFIERLLFDTVLRPVVASSGGASSISNKILPYRVAEIHYADEDAYEKSLAWFKDNPIPPERGPAGRTNFHFYVLTTVLSVDRDNLASVDRALLRPSSRS